MFHVGWIAQWAQPLDSFLTPNRMVWARDLEFSTLFCKPTVPVFLRPRVVGFQIPSLVFMKSRSTEGGLVYSTDAGRMCPICRKAVTLCQCGKKVCIGSTDPVVRVSRETKGRAGKGVTVVRGVPLDPVALVALGKQLKASCGSGGTVKDGMIEVQGDHCERVMEVLRTKGFVVKRAGG